MPDGDDAKAVLRIRQQASAPAPDWQSRSTIAARLFSARFAGCEVSRQAPVSSRATFRPSSCFECTPEECVKTLFITAFNFESTSRPGLCFPFTSSYDCVAGPDSKGLSYKRHQPRAYHYSPTLSST